MTFRQKLGALIIACGVAVLAVSLLHKPSCCKNGGGCEGQCKKEAVAKKGLLHRHRVGDLPPS